MEYAVDSHAHVFCPTHSFARDIPYTPHPSQQGTAAQFQAVLTSHGLTHGLLVAAQPYLYDNGCMLEAIAAAGGRFKGVALLRPGVAEQTLQDLQSAGVVGIRFNLTSFGMREFSEEGSDRLLAQIREMGWFLQIHCEGDELVEAMPFLRRSGVRVMIDHFGRPEVGRGVTQPGFAALLELGRSGPNVVKLSGPFRCSREAIHISTSTHSSLRPLRPLAWSVVSGAPTGLSYAPASAWIMVRLSTAFSAGCPKRRIAGSFFGIRLRSSLVSGRRRSRLGVNTPLSPRWRRVS